MNILLTSVGRRSYIVQYFKEVLGEDGKVFVCNSDPNSVAFLNADEAIVSPLVYDDSYIPFLIDYCKNNDISIVISLFDIDVMILAQNKSLIEKNGIKVVVSDAQFVNICNDKWKSYLFLHEKGFKTPQTYISYEEVIRKIDSKEIMYPIVVKPRFGCGSIGVVKAYNEVELYSSFRRVSRIINQSYLKYESCKEDNVVVFQEMIDGEEYGVDIINDLHSVNRAVLIKKKIAMRSGETDIAVTVDDLDIYMELKRLGSITKHVGNLDCDVFEQDGDIYVIDMNARIGGGYPFSHIAGANLPKAIVEWCSGRDVDDKMFKVEVGVTGYKNIGILKS